MEMNAAVAGLAALAQPARLAVFRLLVRAGPEGVAAGAIAVALDTPPQTLSFHLNQLVAAGLVERRRAGRSIVYSLAATEVRDLLGFLTEDCCQARRALCAPVGATARARRRAQGEGGARPSVLFVCSRNSARSQMAEALMRERAGEQYDVRSAGMRPSAVDPMAVDVMAEIGLDLSASEAADLGAFVGSPVDYAIVVCEQANRECKDIHPFALTRLYWPFDDPVAHDGSSASRRARFREVRDAIDGRIRDWLGEVDPIPARA